MASSWGTLFRITSFGESHGGGVGVVVDGCPPRSPLDGGRCRRTWTGDSPITTPRQEAEMWENRSALGEARLAVKA